MTKKLLKVIELGNPILRTKAKAVSSSEIQSKGFQNFCDNLIATCEARSGVGVAAPQVGVSKRVFVVWSRPHPEIFLEGKFRVYPHKTHKLTKVNLCVLCS